jgi:hypothetical protein
LIPYVGTLVGPHGVVKKLEFLAKDDLDAWNVAHKDVDPLRGGWVEVKRMANPQEQFSLD